MHTMYDFTGRPIPLQWIVTKVQARKQTGTLSLHKAVMYLECFPSLEKERDGGGLIAPLRPFVSFLILPAG